MDATESVRWSSTAEGDLKYLFGHIYKGTCFDKISSSYERKASVKYVRSGLTASHEVKSVCRLNAHCPKPQVKETTAADSE